MLYISSSDMLLCEQSKLSFLEYRFCDVIDSETNKKYHISLKKAYEENAYGCIKDADTFYFFNITKYDINLLKLINKVKKYNRLPKKYFMVGNTDIFCNYFYENIHGDDGEECSNCNGLLSNCIRKLQIADFELPSLKISLVDPTNTLYVSRFSRTKLLDILSMIWKRSGNKLANVWELRWFFNILDLNTMYGLEMNDEIRLFLTKYILLKG